MEKHKANELMAATMQEAVLISAQLARGNTNPTLSGINGSLFSSASSVANTDNFKITLNTVDADVCEKMKSMLGISSMVHAISDNCTEMTFHKNLTPKAVTQSGGNSGNSGEGGTTESDPACQNVNCPNGLTCYHGECKCNNGTFICGEQCCKEGEYCAQGTDSSTYICVTPTESGNCTKNSDCLKESEYCKFSKGSCTNPGIGTCTPKGELIPYTLEFPTRNLTVYKSSTAMNWWGAINLCQAHGKQLVTIKDLGISDESGEIVCYYVYSKTADPTLHCICAGDEGCEETAKGLTQIGTSGSLWLADNPPSGSCLAHRVIMNLSAIGYDSLNRDTYYALCR
jgi:hypothetical protein